MNPFSFEGIYKLNQSQDVSVCSKECAKAHGDKLSSGPKVVRGLDDL